MTRSAAAHAEHDHALRATRGHGPAVARRMSGPVAAPRPRTPSRPPLRLAAGGASIALRVADAALEVSASRTMDRLVRSRGWVLIVAFGLIGIVAMQVSMLKLNAGIGRAVETSATLERSNATLRGEISRLSSGDRIQALAGARGFVMPEPADVTYLRAGDLRSDGRKAARRMGAPDRDVAGPAGSAVAQAPPSLTGAPAVTGAVGAAPATTAAAAPSATAPTAEASDAPASTAVPAVATPAAQAATPTAQTPVPASTPQVASSGGVTVP